MTSLAMRARRHWLTLCRPGRTRRGGAGPRRTAAVARGASASRPAASSSGRLHAVHISANAEDLWHAETAALLEHSANARAVIERTIAHGPYRATFESISTHQAPEWFLDAKFGMFVDWGPWSVAGWAPQAEKATYPDWYEQKLFKEYRDYHEKTWGADIGPDDLIQLLDGGGFNPAALASLAKAAGMQYVVPFLKHHGGYCLWDSSFTHRDAMEWGLKRDLASELATRLPQGGPALRRLRLAQRMGLSHRPRQCAVADVVLGRRDGTARSGDAISVWEDSGLRLRARLSRAVADGTDRSHDSGCPVVRR